MKLQLLKVLLTLFFILYNNAEPGDSSQRHLNELDLDSNNDINTIKPNVDFSMKEKLHIKQKTDMTQRISVLKEKKKNTSEKSN